MNDQKHIAPNTPTSMGGSGFRAAPIPISCTTQSAIAKAGGEPSGKEGGVEKDAR